MVESGAKEIDASPAGEEHQAHASSTSMDPVVDPDQQERVAAELHGVQSQLSHLEEEYASLQEQLGAESALKKMLYTENCDLYDKLRLKKEKETKDDAEVMNYKEFNGFSVCRQNYSKFV